MSRNTRNLAVFKDSLRKQFEESRCRADAIFSLIHPDAFYERPIPERHRFIFYLGHLETFDWNMICRGSFEKRPLHAEFERLFAFGIDPVDGNLPSDRAGDWPPVEEVRRYVALSRRDVDACLEAVDLSSTSQPYVKDGLIFSVAIEHRLMHVETLSYMLHWLPFHQKHRLTFPACDFRPQPDNPQVRVERGPVQLGLNREDGQFGWDNEFEGHIVDVPEFEIDSYKVCNGEFLQFVNAGGYQEQSLWTAEAWNWINANGIQHPKFWSLRGKDWWYRAMFAEIPLPLSWPVFVSHAEACAYARWRNKSLPSEAEFHKAAMSSSRSGPGNFGFQRWEPVPVDCPQTTASFGVNGMVGNGWEWSSTTFAPFQGFERFPFYPGYSADFFDNRHFVVKGASPTTASRLVRPSFRNWFQPQYPYIYAGFRCVQR